MVDTTNSLLGVVARLVTYPVCALGCLVATCSNNLIQQHRKLECLRDDVKHDQSLLVTLFWGDLTLNKLKYARERKVSL